MARSGRPSAASRRSVRPWRTGRPPWRAAPDAA